MTFSLDDGKYFEVPRQALLVESAKFKLEAYKDVDYCVLGIAADSNTQDQAIFGANFIEHYYTVVDHENQSFGIALAAGSQGYITDSFVSNAFMAKVSLSVLSVLVITLLAAFGLAKCRQRRWQKRLQTMRQMSDPNYLVQDRTASFNSKKQSFAKPVRASFNEFAY